jgi:predicted dehydrogenase
MEETSKSCAGAGSDGTTRREFLKQAGVTTAGVLVTGFAKSSAYALAPSRVIGANDRIHIGHIGCGGQGSTHIRMLKEQASDQNIQSIAVCDIYERRLNEAKATTGGQPFHDYRKLLVNPDVDAIWIATPEHWHARMAMDALEAGKHVYLEKPMTRHLDEALKLRAAVKRTGKVLQVGSQGCTDPKWHRAAELIKQGKLGKIVWSQASYCRNSLEGEWEYGIDKDASESNIDWAAFLGPAPKRPFDKERFFRWRKYWDYSAGITSDLFPHRLNPLMLALGPEYPTRVACTGGIYVQKDREVPDTTTMIVDYPSGHTVLVAGSTANEQGLEDEIRGHKATMYLGGNSIEIRPERPFSDEIEGLKEQIGIGEDIGAHERDFLQAVRTGKKPNCDVDLATPVQVALCMAEMSYRESKMLRFDPQKLELVRG